MSNEVQINGQNFTNNSTASLNGPASLTLSTVFLNRNLLFAVIPDSLATGVYSLTVANPDGQSFTLPNVYTVLTQGSDDLYSNDYNLITDPFAPRPGETTELWLTVYRRGGQSTLTDVPVRFYQGNPHTDGSLIAEGLVPFLTARGEGATMPIRWTPISPGRYILCAQIDPNNTLLESDETNNLICRTVVVAPESQDQTAPAVEHFSFIPPNLTQTVQTTLTLTVAASDNGATSSGVRALSFLEFIFNQTAGQWKPVQRGAWVAYHAANEPYAWTLAPSPGIHYLQAWAVDNANNVANNAATLFVNYVPSAALISRNQVQVYRYQLQAGDQLHVQLEPLSGDPDLYIWPPVANPTPWISDLASGLDQIQITVPVAGIYQAEIIGYSAAQYHLQVEITPTTSTTRAKAFTQVINTETTKVRRNSPLLALNNEPQTGSVIPPDLDNPPTSSAVNLFLPMVQK